MKADRPEGALPTPEAHVAALVEALHGVRGHLGTVERWGHQLADTLLGGGRLLACGNGGSAADAQHLTAEIVGRYRDDRQPLSAIALHADTSSVTAIGNDYGYDEVFSRQVRAHGRGGDVLVAISTSGRSPNVLAAVRAARAAGLLTWALTGPAPNPLAAEVTEAVAVPAPMTATVQEVHGVLVHVMCAAMDSQVLGTDRVIDLAAGPA